MRTITKLMLTGIFTMLSFVAVHAQTNYYNKASGAAALQTLANWGTNTDGTGTAPLNFTAASQVFNIVNGTTTSIGASWTVSGTGSKVVLGTPTKAGITFSTTSSFSLTGTVDIPAALSGSNTFNVVGTVSPTFGTLNAGSTVVYSSASNVTVPASTYGNLSFTGSGNTKTVAGSSTIAGTLSITGANTVLLNTTTTPRTYNIGNLSMSAGTLDGGTGTGIIVSTLNILGDFNKSGGIITNSGTSSSSINTIVFNGGGTSNFSNSAATATEYAFWSVANNTILVLGSNFPIEGTGTTLTVASGSLLTAGTFLLVASTTQSVTINGIIRTSNTAGLSGSTTTTLRSTNNPTMTLGATSTVEYYSTSAQAVTARTDYGNVTITGNSTKTAGGIMTLAGDLTINPAATFAAGTFAHNIKGDFTNDGTFTQGTSTINLNGTATQSIGGASTTTFNNLTINKSTGLTSLANSANVSGTLTMTSGNLDISNSNLLLGAAAVSGTFSATRMIYASGTGELRRTYSAAGSYTFPIGELTGTAEYSPVTVNITAGGTAGAYVGVSAIDAKHPNNNNNTNNLSRYWNVNISGAANATATITGTYLAADVTGTLGLLNAAQLKGAFNASTNPWIKFAALSGTTLTATGATLVPGTTSSFSGIANPAVTISGGGTVCQNSAVTLTANPTAGDTYTYAWSGGLGTASTATPPTDSTGTTNYTVTVTDSNGQTATNNTDVTVNPNLVASVSIVASTNTICSGTNVTFTATPVNPGASPTYQWKVNGGNVGTNSTSFSSTALANGDVVTCTLTTTTACTTGSPAVSNGITMSVTPAATAVAGTAVTMCETVGSVNITAGSSATNTSTTTWTTSGTGTFANPNSLTTATYTPSTADINAGSVTLTLTSTGNSPCGNATSNKTLTIYKQPTASAGGSTTICQNQTATVSGASSSNGTIAWTENGAGSITSGATTTTPTYTAAAGDAGNAVTLTMTVSNGTCTAATATYTVNVLALPTAVAGANFNTCANAGAVNITAGSSATNNAGVTWTSSGTGIFANGSSMTLATYTPSNADIAAGSVILTLTATGNGSCTNATSTKTLTILAVPVTTGVVICQGSASAALASSTTCADEAPVTLAAKYPSAGATSGTGTAWGTPASIVSDNNSYATVSGSTTNFSTVNSTSQTLVASGFGFAIPNNAIILGIQSTIGRFRNGTAISGDIQDNSVRLRKSSGDVGSNLGATSTTWPTSEAAANYGGTANLWGTTWTAAEINSSSFGVGLIANISVFFGTRTANVDYINLTVTYKLPGQLNWYTVSSGGTAIATGSSFNPVGATGSGLADTNTPGTYTYYAECSTVAGCRTPTTFVINALPTVSFTGFSGSPYCENAGTVNLTANHPGGTFSGAGITNNGSGTAVFNPATAGVGPHIITYSYTDGNTCVNTTTQTVNVNANVTYYADADSDTYGNAAVTSVSCTGAPAGYVANNTDCNDADNTKHTTYPFYADVDGDSYGAGTLVSVCAVNATTPPANYSLNATDCNDNNASAYQSASLYIDADADGYDNGTQTVCYGASVPAGYSLTTLGSDCNDNDATKHASYPFYADVDGDSYGAGSLVSVCAVNATTPPANYSLNATDCNDNNASVYQSASLYIDVDADGYNNGTQTVCYGASVPAGYSLTTLGSDCNDNNASAYQSASLYIDVDADGYDNGTQTVCYGASVPTGYSLTTLGSDCNDNNALVYQSASLYIDVDADGYDNGTQTVCYGASVPAGYSLTTLGSDCNDNDATKHASYPFYADVDGDSYGAGSLVSVCAVNATTPPANYSLNATDCNDNNASVYQSASLYIDVDADGYNNGTQTVCYGASVPAGYSLTTLGSDCNDNNASVYQSASLYIDVDADGYDNGTQTVCYGASVPTGYSLTTLGSDCNDNDATKHNQYPFYADTDNDGFGAGSSVNVCAVNAATPPSGYSLDNTDCAPTDPAKHASYTFYVDADGDTYGSQTAAVLCAVNATTPPSAGYSVNSTDCDDTKASVHPFAAEIGYNLIDDDCDGLVDEGFPPKNTTITGSMCNTTLPAIDTQLYADVVAGAQGYRWRITTLSGPTAGEVQFLDTSLRVMKLTQLSNYRFNTSYKVELGVYYAGFLQPYTTSNCTVSTPDTTTKLTVCGQTLTAMSNVVYANLVSFATGYRFRITDPLNAANTQVIDRPLREFRMNLVTAFTVQYGKVYNIEVAVRNTDGSYLSYGQMCQLTTPIFPSTSLEDALCEDYLVPDNNTQIYAYSQPAAIAYVFKLTGPGLPSGGAEVTRTLRAFKLSDFHGLVPGATYNVQVRVIFNSTDPAGPFGKTCTIVTPGLSRPTPVAAAPFNAVAYPNPFADTFGINVTTSAAEKINVKVYDMTGKLLEAKSVNADEFKSLQIGDGYPSGIYNVIVNQGDAVKTLRVIKR